MHVDTDVLLREATEGVYSSDFPLLSDARRRARSANVRGSSYVVVRVLQVDWMNPTDLGE